METGYIPLDEDKKKLNSPQQLPPLGEPLSIQVCAIGLLHYCIPLCETCEILERATPYHKDDTTSIPYPCLGLAECTILANQVMRR